MKITVNLLDNQKLEASFEDYKILSDQPLSNKGEALAPSPFDYFLASTALCAGYFAKAYCTSRNLPIEGIQIIQNNTKDTENKYKQVLEIQVFVPSDFSEKDRLGILRSIEGCSVKKAIQQLPDFKVEVLSL